MATTPNLTIELTLADQKLIQDFTAFAKRFQNAVNQNQTKVNAIQTQGQAKTVAIQNQTNAKVQQINQVAQAKQQATLQAYYARQQVAQLKAQTKMLKAQTSWSAKMTKNLGTLVTSVRTFAIAYATMFASRAVHDALDFISTLRDLSKASNVSTQNIYALREAYAEVGLGADKASADLNKINSVLANPSPEQYKQLIKLQNQYGTLTSNVEVLNAVLKDETSANIILGKTGVESLNAITKNYKDLNDAISQYPLPITDADIDRLDNYGTQFRRLGNLLSIELAKVFASPQVDQAVTRLVNELTKLLSVDNLEAFSTLLALVVNALASIVNQINQIMPLITIIVDALDLVANTFRLIFATFKGDTEESIASWNRILDTMIAINTQLKNFTLFAVKGFNSFTSGLPFGNYLQIDTSALEKFFDRNTKALADAKTAQDNALEGTKNQIDSNKSVIKALDKNTEAINKSLFAGNFKDFEKNLGVFFDTFKDLKSGINTPALPQTFLQATQITTQGKPSNALIAEIKAQTDAVKKLQDEYDKLIAKGKAQALQYGITGSTALNTEDENRRVKLIELIDVANKELENLKTKQNEAGKQLLVTGQKNLEELIDAQTLANILFKKDVQATSLELVKQLKGVLSPDQFTAFIKKYNLEQTALDYTKKDLSEHVKSLEKEKDSYKQIVEYIQYQIALNRNNGDVLDYLNTQLDKYLDKARKISQVPLASGRNLSKNPFSQEELDAQARYPELPGGGFSALTRLKFQIDEFKKGFEKALPYIEQIFNGINAGFDLMSVGLDNQIAKTQKLIEEERKRWEAQSEALKQAGLESSAYYRNLQRNAVALEKKREQQLEAQQAKAFDLQKASNISQAVQAGSLAFVKALPDFFLASLVAITTAVQIATIASQKNPYHRAFGGLIPGDRPNSDSVPVLATGGEFIVNRRATSNNLGLLEAINSGKTVNNSPTINIHINGGMIDKDFVNTKLTPMIKKALKDNY